jgi:hypothetical protein
MTSHEHFMTVSTDRSELFLRCSRRNMIVVLVLVLLSGTVGLAITLAPGSGLSHWVERASRFIPIAFIIGIASMRGHRWNPNSPEVKAVMNDEWRLTNLDRALRTSFIVVLLAQMPLGILFGAIPGLLPWKVLAQLPAERAVIAMGVSTISLGMITLISLFLFFDRD